MFGDTSLFWLWFVLIIVVLVVWVLFMNDCKDGKDRKDNKFNDNLECAAEGTFILLSLPLVVYILFFILLGLVLLAGKSWYGRWIWDRPVVETL